MNKTLRFTIFLILSIGLSAQAQDMYIVLLAGQSNMAGRGIYSQLSAKDTVTYSNILSLNKDSVWVRAKHPLHWDKAEAAVGMGISFAHELALKIGGNVKIGLVPCAAGGTSIENWLSSSYIFNFNGNSFNPYANLIKRAKKAAKSGEIIGMIWHQGETNSTTSLYPTYQNKLKDLFVKIRTDLNKPNLPIVAGELGTYLASNKNCPRWDSVNVSINRLKNSLSNYDVASSVGLIANSDNTHFSAMSLVTFGKRYADLFYPIALFPSSVKKANLNNVKIRRSKSGFHLSLDTNGTSVVKIINMLGQTVQKIEVYGYENEIITKCNNGFYLVNIQNKTGDYSQTLFL